MLQIIGYYRFTDATAILAVNYFDRFVFGFYFQKDKPSMSQLAAVACLSIAAKIEETQVPLLLDLQDNLDECHDLILELIGTYATSSAKASSANINRYLEIQVVSLIHILGVRARMIHDLQRWHLLFLAFGIMLLVMAPIVSSWVLFYYNSLMAIRVCFVIIVLLFQKIPKGFELMANLEVLDLHMLDGTLDPEFLLLTTATYVDSSGNLLVISTYQHQKILSGVQNEEGDEEIDLT
ncbi:hypothetical protein FXO37_09514 [Capsicum annuum]|nr:hypothetical protein FXO37_09514 [Capsicum annuum]